MIWDGYCVFCHNCCFGMCGTRLAETKCLISENKVMDGPKWGVGGDIKEFVAQINRDVEKGKEDERNLILAHIDGYIEHENMMMEKCQKANIPDVVKIWESIKLVVTQLRHGIEENIHRKHL